MSVKIYVEGGGDHNKDLDTQCRRGFGKFFERAGLKGRMPSVVRCGGRRHAFDSFCSSHEKAGEDYLPILLVDSEAPVAQADPWEHVRLRPGDGWRRPSGASQDQIHFMVEAMEAWFHADKQALVEFFGQGFRIAALSQRPDIDNIPKADLYARMQLATKDCQTKGEYSKGHHSFRILALINPAKVRTSSPQHAGRLLDVLDRECAR
ncbi:MAG: DUF4276 family protein [Bryobacteraceae bacterium]